MRFILAGLVLAIGCAPTPPTALPPASTTMPDTPPSDLPVSGPLLDGTAWALESIGDEAAPAGATLVFAEGQVGGTSGCNRFSGPYSAASGGVVGPSFQIGPMASTRRMCGPEQAFETRYFDALRGARRWLVDDDELELIGKGERLLFSQSE